MLAKIDGEEGFINLMGSCSNLFTTRNFKSVEEILCKSSCSGCNFYSSNPGCKILEYIVEIEEIKIILATFGQFYE
jgi:hypothetical protein